MIAVSIGNGSGDAQGSQRGLEYDTMSGLYAEFVETEVLPLVEKQYKVRITKDPDARATMGCSSGGSAAMAMAWYRPDLYHRVLTYSGTYVNQQWPYNPETPGGAWEFHRTLIPKSPVKPLRIWMHVSRSRQLQPERRHARLGAREPEHGERAGGQGLQIPVRVRAQCRPLRSHGEGADAAERARVRVEGLSRSPRSCRNKLMNTQTFSHDRHCHDGRRSFAARGAELRSAAAAAGRHDSGAAGARQPSAAARRAIRTRRVTSKRRHCPTAPVPPADAYGNFIIGPTYTPAPEMTVQPAVLEGTVHTFTMESTDSKIYPGIRREQGTFGTPDPNNPAKLDVTTSAPAPYTRRVAVYIPSSTSPARSRPSSSALTDPIRCCSRRSTR